MEVRPESKTGQNISVDQAREIRRNAALRPKLGLRRVYLIPNAEAFNEESANALLKTLEEPSDFVTLLLCAPGPSQVLPTIRSRCQIVRFGLAAPEELAEALQAAGTEPEAARALARASGGRPGLALTWAQEPSALRQRARVLELFAGALSAQRRARDEPQVGILSLRLAEQLRGLAGPEKGEEDGPARPAKALHSENLETGLSYLRDLLLLAGGASAELAQNQDRLSELIDLAGHTDPGRVLDDVRAVREAQQFLERNVAPQLVLERMFWGLISGAVSSQPGLFRDAL
jgi:DNA polymerase-3 subunit delta'